MATLSWVRARRTRPSDLAVAVLLSVGCLALFAAAATPDWSYDPTLAAALTQGGKLAQLLLPAHALGNLIPLMVFRALRAIGFDGGAEPVLAVVSAVAAASALGLVYLAGVRLGGSRWVGVAAGAMLAATPGLWRAGGSGDVYGVAVALLALAWLALARYVERPSRRRAITLGLAAGAAIAGHLALVAFLPSAVVVCLRAATPEASETRGAGRRAVLMLGACAITVGGAFLLTAAVASGFSPHGILEWFRHSNIGGATDRSAAIGWGIAGLYSAIAGNSSGLAKVVAFGVVAWCAGRGVALLTRPGRPRLVGVALLSNVTLAYVAASWYQALRADYFALGLIPLVLLLPAGELGARSARRTARPSASFVVAALLVPTLVAWSLRAERPIVRKSHAVEASAATIAGRVPPGAHLLLSGLIAARVRQEGFDAQTGWDGLREKLDEDTSTVPVQALVQESARTPVVVSSFAFRILPAQATALGTDEPGIWEALRAGATLEPLLRFTGEFGTETLYLLVPRT